jgi:catechol 2,3-dioxygenase-like lactoylglutathione lyase family enzyme
VKENIACTIPKIGCCPELNLLFGIPAKSLNPIYLMNAPQPKPLTFFHAEKRFTLHSNYLQEILPMPITMFDHYTLRSANVEVTAEFYAKVMGFRVEKLESFAFPMRLLFLGDQAIVHLMGAGLELDEFLARSAPSITNGPERKTGNMEHVAFNGTGLRNFKKTLYITGVRYVQRNLADYGVAQFLFDDPDGVEIEVNFPISELAS